MRSRDILSLMSGRSLWRIARGAARAPFDERYAGSPLAVCWFTNFSCNARCPFCCKAHEIRNGKNRFPPLTLDRAKVLMAKVRRTVDILYLSGGEPLIHPHILDLVKEARRLEFSAVGMSSNLIALDKHPEVLEYLDAISVSIHSPDVAIHAANLAVSPEIAQRAFDNLKLIENHPRRKCLKLVVNCVINAGNLDTVREMVSFTKQHGCLLELVPAGDDGRPSADLANNPRYEELIDDVLAMRKSGEAPHLAGSTKYYERIKTFEPFRCFPYGVPNIMPDGRLCTPCDVSRQYAVNVLDFADLRAALEASGPHLGDYPCKQGHCFKAGIIERSRLYGLIVRDS